MNLFDKFKMYLNSKSKPKDFTETQPLVLTQEQRIDKDKTNDRKDS